MAILSKFDERPPMNTGTALLHTLCASVAGTTVGRNRTLHHVGHGKACA